MHVRKSALRCSPMPLPSLPEDFVKGLLLTSATKNPERSYSLRVSHTRPPISTVHIPCPAAQAAGNHGADFISKSPCVKFFLNYNIVIKISLQYNSMLGAVYSPASSKLNRQYILPLVFSSQYGHNPLKFHREEYPPWI